MWKLTSWGFRKCGSFWRLELLNHSYQPPKSGQNPEKKFRHRACHKKIRQIQFFLKSLFLLREVFKWYLENPLRRNKLLKKIERALFFCDIRYFPWRTHFCRPVLTLSCNNYIFDHMYPYVTHIFGKLSPCSFSWYYPWKIFHQKIFEERGI